jgi:Holliday junction resolvase
MTRSRQSAKQAGTRFERQIADYLAEALQDDRIDRMPLFGNRDRGDVSGVRIHGQRLTIECKDRARLDLPTWTEEVRKAAGNADALTGVVIAKRHGCGDPGRQWVICTVDDFVAIVSGQRGDQ